MGHTAKSARFTGVLSLLVISGLIGLAGSGSGVDSTLPRSQESSVSYFPLKSSLSAPNSSVATKPVSSIARVFDGDELHVGGSPFYLRGDQMQPEVSSDVSMINVAELHRVSFSVMRSEDSEAATD